MDKVKENYVTFLHKIWIITVKEYNKGNYMGKMTLKTDFREGFTSYKKFWQGIVFLKNNILYEIHYVTVHPYFSD